jgi:hypothetical protein
MACNSYATSFGRMLILSVTAFRDNQILAPIAIFDDAGAYEGGEIAVL